MCYVSDTGGRSDPRGERPELRGGDARRGRADSEDEQAHEPAYTGRWQGAALVHDESADGRAGLEVSGSRFPATRESWNKTLA